MGALLAGKAKTHVRNKHGLTPLGEAVAGGHLPVAKALADGGAAIRKCAMRIARVQPFVSCRSLAAAVSLRCCCCCHLPCVWARIGLGSTLFTLHPTA